MTSRMAVDVKALNAIDKQDTARRSVKLRRFARVNARRAELIYLHPVEGSPEHEELSVLQECVRRLIDLAHPIPPADPKLIEICKRLGEPLDGIEDGAA